MNDEQLIWEAYRRFTFSEEDDDDQSEVERDNKCKELLSFIDSIKPQLALAAEKVYNDWDQDEEGVSEEYGSGGICDKVADSLASTFDSLKPETLKGWDSFTMYKENECHTDMYVVNHEIKKIYEVGLPPHAYESGGGYTWKKKREHEINPAAFHVTDTYLDYENFFDENGDMHVF
jgi:hypothetical protein